MSSFGHPDSVSCTYAGSPLGSIASLGRLLGVEPSELLRVSAEADRFVFVAKPITKPNGEVRYCYDAEPCLKRVQRRVKERILDRVWYPRYLYGGISDPVFSRDYSRNAHRHRASAELLSLDIRSFYPSVSDVAVASIFRRFFHFEPQVASTLALICAPGGELLQGMCTSTHIANLLFWDVEPGVVQWCRARSLEYSRLTDDISVSSRSIMSSGLRTATISKVVGMLSGKGVKLHRGKFDIARNGKPMRVNKLLVNAGRPTMNKHKRGEIRAAVHGVEKMHATSSGTKRFGKKWRSARGHVATLARFHPKEAATLVARLQLVRPR